MVKKSKEITNHNTELQPLTNSRTWYDFLENDSFMDFPEKADWRKRFCLTMLLWSEKEDSVEITDFAIEVKRRRQTIYEWADKYPDIKRTFDYVKLIIASRRKKGMLTRKFDKDVVFKDLHKYDPEWLDINKYHSDMKKEEDKQSHTFIVDTSRPAVTTKEEMVKERERDI